MKILFILISLFSYVICVQAQGNKEWHYFGDGSHVTALAETFSSLWVGTSGGLVHYDKSTGKGTVYDKTNTSLPRNHISTLALDQNDELWIGTQSGLTHKTSSTWTTYNFDSIILPYYEISLLIADDNTVWAGLANGYIASVKNGQLTLYNIPNLPWGSITSLAEDSAGNIWMGFSGTGSLAVVMFDGSNFTTYSASELGFTSSGFFDYNNALAIDGSGNKWISHNSGELVKWRDTIKTKIMTKAHEPKMFLTDKEGYVWMLDVDSNLFKIKDTIVSTIKLPGRIANALSMNTTGKMWLGTNTGLYEYISGSWIRRRLPSENAPTGKIYALDVSDNKEVWVNYARGDMYPDSIHWEDFSDDVYPDVRSILHAPGGITWLGTGNGLFKYDGQKYTLYNSTNSDLRSNIITSLALDTSGALWVGTNYGGLAHFDGTNWLIYNSSNSALVNNQVNSLAVTKDNILWAGTPISIVAYDGMNWQDQNLSISYVNDIDIDSLGKVWISSSSGFLKKYDSGGWATVNLPVSGSVRVIALEGSSDLWVGIQGHGLYHFDGLSWEGFTPANSPMPSVYIYSLEVDANGNKWIGTDKGLLVYKKNGIAVGSDEKKQNEVNTLTLYPNPANDKISIDLPANSPVQGISIYNVTGQLIYQAGEIKTATIQIDLKDFKPGIYMLKVQTGDGKVSGGRFIKM